MAFGIYKAGQGYWVRALTAALAGAFVLWMGVWVWDQANAITLPQPNWDLAVEQVRGTLDEGELVSLERDIGNDATAPFGTGTIKSFDVANGVVRVGDLNLNENTDPSQAVRIVVESAPGAASESAVVLSRRGVTIFPQIYLQLGGFSLVVLFGSIIIYYLVGVARKSSEFLIATDGEMKKVNWGTRKDVIGSTWVVVVASFLIALVLFVIDLGFSRLFRFIGVLEV